MRDAIMAGKIRAVAPLGKAVEINGNVVIVDVDIDHEDIACAKTPVPVH